MEKEKKYLPWIGILVFILYFLYNMCQDIPLRLIGIDYQTLSLTSRIFYLIGYELIFIIILFLIYHKRFINDFKDFILNFKAYIKKYLEYWVFAFGLMLICNYIIVTFFPNSVANNQEAIESIFAIAPIYMFISAAIFAPFLEETVFRLSFRNIFKNDTLFVIISGLVFGAMHVIGSFEQWIDLIYIIPYSIPGFVFAYTLVKSKNIFVPIGLHFFHNSFSMILQIILSFLM